MNKTLALALLITSLFSGLIFYYLAKESQNNLSVNKKSPSPTLVNKATPEYSVNLLNKPVINGNFSIKVDVKNASVKPFITRIKIDHCKFFDNKNNQYNGFIYTPAGASGLMHEFPKALLPGESQVVDFPSIGIDLEGGGGVDIYHGLQSRCTYDDSGNKICKPIEGFKITECVSYISTSIERDDQFPLVLRFE